MSKEKAREFINYLRDLIDELEQSINSKDDEEILRAEIFLQAFQIFIMVEDGLKAYCLRIEKLIEEKRTNYH